MSRTRPPRIGLGVAAVLLSGVACTGGPSHSAAVPSSGLPSVPASSVSAAASSAATTAAGSFSAAAGTSAAGTSAASSAAATSSAAGAASSGTAFSAAASKASVTLAHLTLAQRVGQLFMVGTPAAVLSPTLVTDIRKYHVGNVILTGRSTTGVKATSVLTARIQALATAAATGKVAMFVGADQEGGLVQVLRGPGFSTMPTALTQGSWSAAHVRTAARTWGAQLAAAGVEVDLAPVLDTVPSPAFALSNAPIGHYRREYGFTPALVSSRGGAFAAGLAAAHVDPAVKHFPGLGRVTANTDVVAGVRDTITRRHDPYLTPYADAITAGAPFVMMSTAIYTRIDPARPAAFSPVVIGTLLRGDLHFRGVVISDDLGNARQVAAWSPGTRAVDFVAAGGDMVLTVNPSVLPAMYTAVLAKAEKDPAFRARVDAAALRVLTAKQARGLL